MEVHVEAGAAGASVVEVTLNEKQIHSTTAATVSNAPRVVQLGNGTAKQAFTLSVDDVLVTEPVT